MKLKTQNLFLAIAMLLASLGTLPPQPVLAAPNTAELIAEINALRASNGLPALRVDPYLTASAQSHSQYQASIGTWTHTGAGGSTYSSRAIAAGYGGGSGVYVRENVAMTTSSGTTSYIVYTLWADAVHWNTMLNSSVVDIGVGVAESNGWYYYTMDVGAVNGQASAPTKAPPNPSGDGSQAIQPTANPISAIITSTPGEDGSVIHEVQSGQALWSIAVAYATTADAIKKLNAMTSDIIYTGQKLVVQPSFTPTLSPTVTET
ncbi:MAG TPA: CAP domain-containing protein, partial [Anaerolineaceae bacterium]|nr:CAP domain-containing protein [Anaerolineaceae bacterium]